MIDRTFDIHTHNQNPPHQAVISIHPGEEMRQGFFYSVGIHPWETNECNQETINLLRENALNPQVVAIGETGLDHLRGANVEKQTEIFIEHVKLSEKTCKPLILHVVKTFPEIIALKKRIKPSQPWIIHGFRGNPILAQELLRHDFDLSLGEKFNPATLKVIPRDRLWVETDTSSTPFTEIWQKIMG